MAVHIGWRRLLGAGVALSVIASLGACGSDQAVTNGNGAAGDGTAVGTLAGAGASSQKSATETWIAEFSGANPQATITFDPVGSGAGISQFLQGAVAFAATDEALTPAEVASSKKICGGTGAIDLPGYLSPVAVVFNLPGITELNLTPQVIAKIFRGEIAKWNDPDITAINPQAKLPATGIVAVHRADKSGTTENFTDYAHQAAPEIWKEKPSKEWPLAGGEAADKTAGVIQVVRSTPGTITYADASQAKGLGIAKLQVDNTFVAPSAAAAAHAVAISPRETGRAAGDLVVEIDRTPTDPAAYPLVLVSYLVVCPQTKDEKRDALTRAYLEYVTSLAGQEAAAKATGSAPLTGELATQVAEAVAQIGA